MRKIVPRRIWLDQSHIWSCAPDLRHRPSSCPPPFFNRRPMTSDASIELTGERPAGNRQSHGSSCDRHVPVAHLSVLLRQPPIDRASRRRRYQNPLFPVATSLCDVAHFFPISMGLRCECLAHNVRLTCTANSNPKENDHAVDLKGASDALTQKSQRTAGEAQKNAENKKQAEALKRVPAGAATALRRRSSWPEKDRPESAEPRQCARLW